MTKIIVSARHRSCAMVGVSIRLRAIVSIRVIVLLGQGPGLGSGLRLVVA
jgi:hypothetical protein